MANRIDTILNDIRSLKDRARHLKDGGRMLDDLKDLEAQIVFFLIPDVGASLQRAKRIARGYQQHGWDGPTDEDMEEIKRTRRVKLRVVGQPSRKKPK